MRIELQKFPKDELVQVSCSYNPKSLDLDFVDLHFKDPLILTGTVEKSSDALTFRGKLQGRVCQTCGRCLTESESPLEKTFQLYYETRGIDIIDATQDLREVLILDHPLHYLCNENCKGLCPRCGINRNEKICQCKQDQGSEGTFYKLKEIWKNKNRS